MEKSKIVEALKQLKSLEPKKFEQSLDLLINLKGFDIKRDNINLFLTLPNKFRDAKVCAFLSRKSQAIDTVSKEQFDKYDKKAIKKLVSKYDFFISSAALMPLVAKTFGRYLGAAGKMPSPQLGVVKEETDEELNRLKETFNRVVRIKSKEPSLKFSVGKEKMADDALVENILKAYDAVFHALPKQKENIRSVMIKLTMSKPIKLE